MDVNIDPTASFINTCGDKPVRKSNTKYSMMAKGITDSVNNILLETCGKLGSIKTVELMRGIKGM